MSKVIAKFRVDTVTQHPKVDEEGKPDGFATHVKLVAVQDEIFGPHTPHGELNMTIHNDAAAKAFEHHMQEEYMVEFIPASEYM